jgi:hypothetical protein
MRHLIFISLIFWAPNIYSQTPEQIDSLTSNWISFQELNPIFSKHLEKKSSHSKQLVFALLSPNVLIETILTDSSKVELVRFWFMKSPINGEAEWVDYLANMNFAWHLFNRTLIREISYCEGGNVLYDLKRNDYSFTKYFCDGSVNITADSSYNFNPLGMCEIYQFNGKLLMKGALKYQKYNEGYLNINYFKVGSWKYYNEKGQLYKEEYFENGRLSDYVLRR